MSAADPCAAIAGYLKAQIGTLVGGRVFRPRLPRVEDQHMPRACIVVKPAGGYAMFGRSSLKLGDPRVDVISYGSSDQEADTIAREVLATLRNMPSTTVEATKVYAVHISGGVMPLVDPETLWNYSLVSAQVICAEQAVT